MFKNIKVKAKLSILVGIALVSIVIIAWRGLVATNDINNALNTIVDTNIVRIKTAEEMTIALIAMQRAEKNMILASSQEDMDKYEKSYLAFQKKFQEWAKKMQTVVSVENRPKVERCMQIASKDYDDIAHKIMKLTRDDKNDEAIKLSNEGRKFIDECESIMNELIESNEQNMTIASQQMDEEYIFARNLVLGLSLLSLIGLLSIAYLVTGIITGSLRSVQNGLLSFFSYLNRETDKAEPINLNSKDEFGEMAVVINDNIEKVRKGIEEDRKLIDETITVLGEFEQGDLCQRLELNVSNPALMQLKSVLNNMASNLENNIDNVLKVLEEYSNYNYLSKVDEKGLKEHLLQLATGVNTLGGAVTNMLSTSLQNGIDLQSDASNLKQAVEALSTASNEQAASLEETAAAMEEMTSNVQNNAHKSNDMAIMAKETDKAAKEGAALAQRTASAMTEIQAATNSINDAVAIIENIAFQTNILSLNAAVEAATAGDAGKGFAVVAQEVRNLANRSADAAKEIKAMAVRAAEKSNEGMNISTELTKGFEVIASKIEQTTMLVQDVSNASKEQMQGIGQINTAVTQLDQMTQENAKVAAQADSIANATIDKAEAMVEDAQSKEFVGKENIQHKSRTMVKPAQVAKAVYAAKPVHVKKSQNGTKAISNAKNDDDIWESF